MNRYISFLRKRGGLISLIRNWNNAMQRLQFSSDADLKLLPHCRGILMLIMLYGITENLLMDTSVKIGMELKGFDALIDF